MMLYRWCHWKW